MSTDDKGLHRLEIFEGNVAINWEKWLRSFEIMMAADSIDKPKQKKCKLLHHGGVHLQEVYYSFPDDAEDANEKADDEFKSMVKLLNKHFSAKSNSTAERLTFRELKQKSDESISQYLVRLRTQASRCEYEAKLVSEQIRDQLIASSKHPGLKKEVRKKGKVNLDDVIDMIKGMEIEESNENNNEVNKIKYGSGSGRSDGRSGYSRSESNSRSQRMSDSRDQGPSRSGGGSVPTDNKNACFRCGKIGHFSRSRDCPARSIQCDKCKIWGHVAKMCRTRLQNRKVDFIDHERFSESSDNEVLNVRDNNLIGSNDVKVICKLGGVKVRMTVDSGAAVNIISEETYEKALNKNIKIIRQCKNVGSDLKGYGGIPIEVKKMIRVLIEFKDRKLETDIQVVKGSGTSLLGCRTAIDLKIISFDVRSILKYESRDRKEGSIGKLKDVQIEIHVDETVTPVRQRYRRVPVPLKEIVSAKLRELLKNDIIERVDGISAWISPLVVVPKGNGSDVRLCVDMREANRAIVREVHPLPTFDDIMPNLSHSKVFSKLDIKNAFHQVEITPRSREITTFMSHDGVYRFKRLMFGMTCASEVFQKVMENLLIGIVGVIVYIDDILIFSETIEAHNKILDLVLFKLKSNGIILNTEKCEYRKEEIIFMGHILTGRGVRPAQSKIADIQNFRAPHNKEEVRSFLGLLNYVGRFIPNLASESEPLKKLTRIGNKFDWTKEQEDCFQKLKTIIVDETMLGYYDSKDKTIIVADASPYGLGGVLIQENGDGVARVVSFVSKGLTDIEKKYSQTEKEALALVWVVERFKMYVMGKRFDLITDHRPLEILFKPSSKPCPRIERWVLRLQSFNMNVIYKPGKTNIADPLSRLSQEEYKTFDKKGEGYLNQILHAAVPKALTLKEVKEAVLKDEELTELKYCLKYGTWPAEMSRYKKYTDEFSEVDGILLRFQRIVVPQGLQRQILELAHEGHPGESVMKRRLRTKTWWYNQDVDVVQFVKSCQSCQMVAKHCNPEPLFITELPKRVWSQLRADFLGPLPSGEYILVITDDYSRFVIVEIMRTITSEKVIAVFKTVVTRFGLPDTIITDNGPQFISKEFYKYCDTLKIKIKHTIPLSPQSNGEVERQNRSLLKRLRIAQVENKDFKDVLNDYLLMYTNSIHPSTGVSPAKLMFNRNFREKIPAISEEEIVFDDEVRENDHETKLKRKEYFDTKRHAVQSDIAVGDTVLKQNDRHENKLSPNYCPETYVVKERNGKAVVIENSNGQCYTRRTDHLKRLATNPEVQHPNPIVSIDESGVQMPSSICPNSIRSQQTPTKTTRNNLIPTKTTTQKETFDEDNETPKETVKQNMIPDDDQQEKRSSTRDKRKPGHLKNYVCFN